MPIVSRITDMFGCWHPLQQAGMGGVANPDLAIAVARAGAVGMLSGAIGHEALSAQLDAVPVDATIGVSFLMPFLDRAAVDEAARRSPFVEFFWATPDRELVDIVHSGGARVGWQVGSSDEAKAARDAGCDVIVAQGIEAGGHVRGTLGLLPLLAATESTAHPAYVAALIQATAEDTVITTAFGDGWPDAPHRVLKSSIDAGRKLGAAHSWSPDWPQSTYTGAAEARALYAGQSVGAVRARQSAAEIVAELVQEAEQRLTRP